MKTSLLNRIYSINISIILLFIFFLFSLITKAQQYDQWGERAPTPFVDTAKSHIVYEAPNQIQVKDLHYTDKKYMDSLHIVTIRAWNELNKRALIDQILKDAGLISGAIGHKIWIEIKHDSKIVFKGIIEGWSYENKKIKK